MNNQQILMQFEQRFRNVFSLTDEEWQAFANQSVVRIVAKGDALFNAGDVADKVRFVCSGTLCNFYLTPDGNRRNKSFLQAGEVSACLSSFARGLPARFSCEALTDAVCVEISAKALKALSESTVGWQNAFLQMVTVLALKKKPAKPTFYCCHPLSCIHSSLKPIQRLHNRWRTITSRLISVSLRYHSPASAPNSVCSIRIPKQPESSGCSGLSLALKKKIADFNLC
ncbi:cyclic nucleotide-binding domain-containing protein [Enterovibrio sp. Hal110]